MSEETTQAWTSVDNSSLISAIRYNPDTKELDALFKSNGAKYRYFDVPNFIYEEIKTSDTPGKVFNAHVIKAGKKYKKL